MLIMIQFCCKGSIFLLMTEIETTLLISHLFNHDFICNVATYPIRWFADIEDKGNCKYI